MRTEVPSEIDDSTMSSQFLPLIGTALGGLIAAASGAGTAVLTNRLTRRLERERFDRQEKVDREERHQARLESSYVELLRFVTRNSARIQQFVDGEDPGPPDEDTRQRTQAIVLAYGSTEVWKLLGEYNRAVGDFVAAKTAGESTEELRRLRRIVRSRAKPLEERIRKELSTP
jgi:hypothetical protein